MERLIFGRLLYEIFINKKQLIYILFKCQINSMRRLMNKRFKRKNKFKKNRRKKIKMRIEFPHFQKEINMDLNQMMLNLIFKSQRKNHLNRLELIIRKFSHSSIYLLIKKINNKIMRNKKR